MNFKQHQVAADPWTKPTDLTIIWPFVTVIQLDSDVVLDRKCPEKKPSITGSLFVDSMKIFDWQFFHSWDQSSG